MIASVKKGDRVLTTGGLFGRVIHVHETMLVVQVAKDVNVEIAKSAVASVEAGKE
jgi:preprotein translocase subunit YajC